MEERFRLVNGIDGGHSAHAWAWGEKKGRETTHEHWHRFQQWLDLKQWPWSGDSAFTQSAIRPFKSSSAWLHAIRTLFNIFCFLSKTLGNIYVSIQILNGHTAVVIVASILFRLCQKTNDSSKKNCDTLGWGQWKGESCHSPIAEAPLERDVRCDVLLKKRCGQRSKSFGRTYWTESQFPNFITSFSNLSWLARCGETAAPDSQIPPMQGPASRAARSQNTVPSESVLHLGESECEPSDQPMVQKNSQNQWVKE